MLFIVRWPVVLVLFALTLFCFLGAAAAAGALTGFSTGVAQVEEAQAAAVEAGAAQASWIEVGLLAGAGLFFMISAIRLIRRTQGFWTWLLGFALFGGRWALAQRGELAATVQGLNVSAFLQPQAVIADPASPEAQVALLGIILVVGLLIFILDAADRAHWDKQGA
ncbi:MAG: hypothetical protein NW206_01865 [Hyphomonadaceae bacterium]|nr:hypothetical protein [Hyphomonadaceae bacterium]